MRRTLEKIFYFLTIFVIIFNVDNTYAKNYYITSSEVVDNESNVPCWTGWKEWHFGATSPLSKKGDTVIFKTPMIQNGVTTYFESEVTTNGYGHYGLDFSKHMLGLLSYMKDKVTDYPTNYIPIYDQPELDEQGNVILPSPVKMKKAVEITIGKLISAWHPADYEENEFKDFWTKCFTDAHVDELRKLQNNFYWKAYGEEAWALLKRMMNAHGSNYYNNLTSDQKTVLKGVLFSVMEARYRNKNVQGKADLKIKAAEGELWPFLVNLKNLNKIVRSGSSGHYIYTDSVRQYTFYEFPPFDDLIDGVYHWMIYYDSDILNATTHSTLTSKQAENEDEEEINADWESEYWSLTGIPIETLNREKLEGFYTNCQLVRSIFKKSTANSEGIFGAEEVYDITSDINFSEALINMKNSMQVFANDVGGDIKKIFNGLDSEHISRTYTMAKNIVATYRIKDEYAYYDIGTNIINYTPGLEGNEFMLIDFQKVKLKSPLEIYDNGRIKTYEDSDNDGIYDRNEIRSKQKVDITGFVKKMIEKELYGNDDKSIRENQAFINSTLAKVKYNIYNNRHSFDEENSSNNVQNRKEIYENSMNIDEGTIADLNGITSAAVQQQRLAMVPSKIEVELWKYDSNPMLKDTDFDGIDDGQGKEKLREIERSYGLTDDEADDVKTRSFYCKLIPDAVVQTLRKDKNPKNNHFTGRMNTSRLSGDNAIEVDMNMDYRYFFLSNKLYFDELSTMSLLYSNSIYRRGKEEDGSWMEHHSGIAIKDVQNIASDGDESMEFNGTNYKNLKVKDMMEFFGFKNVKTYYMGEEMDNTASDYNIDEDPADGADYCRGYKDTHKGKVALGYKTIEYHGIYKNVIGIVIRGTAEDDDWDSDFDMGDKKLKEELKYESGKEKYDHNYNEILKVIDKGVLDYDNQYAQELLHFAGGYPDWKWTYHHAGFDIVANRILEVIKEYYEEVKDHFSDDIEIFDENTIENPVTANSVRNNDGDSIIDAGVCYWVTGHSMGAGVANLVAASLISSEAIHEISELEGNSNNVYCYTFAAPNTFYRPDNQYSYESRAIPGKNVTGDYREPKGVKYRCIFNIVNDDDFVPKLPMEECEWTKYGREARLSIEKDLRHKFIKGFAQSYDYSPSEIREENPISELKKKYGTYLVRDYKSNKFAVDSVVALLNGVYDYQYAAPGDKNNMRNETYSYSSRLSKSGNVNYSQSDLNELNENIYYIYINDLDDFIFEYSRPFQKNDKNIFGYSQKQTPAYLMQSIASAMHTKIKVNGEKREQGKENSFLGTKVKDNQYRFIKTKMAYSGIGAKWSILLSGGPLDALETPHFLESYYSLVKELSTVDFR